MRCALRSRSIGFAAFVAAVVVVVVVAADIGYLDLDEARG